MSNCEFSKAWIGPCGKALPCSEHKNLKCCSCGEPATHDCGETGQFVCGHPLCDDCEHRTFEDGCNGGVGFNQQSLPEGEKRHCKKSEQKHKPWYKQGVT